MSKVNVSRMLKSVQRAAEKHSPEILTGIGIAGMLTAVVLAVKATPKALQIIEIEKGEKEVESLTAVDTVKATWKCYIPTAVTCILSTACLIGSSRVNLKRNAALATAYTLSEAALNEYKNKVVEVIGEKKEEAIHDAIAKDKIEKAPISTKEVIITDAGSTLCYDELSGRYFHSDIETLRKAVNDLNFQMMDDMYVSLNEFYWAIGLGGTTIGEQLGWNITNGKIELRYSSQLAEDGRPCLVIDYRISPKYNFQSSY